MKKLVVAVGSLLGLLVLAILVVPLLVPIDALKPEIVAQVKSATGRDLRISGPMRLDLFPRLSIEMEDVALSNPKGSRTSDMVDLTKVGLVLELLPLLSGEIVIGSFQLDTPVIALEVAKSGKFSWSFEKPSGDSDAEAKPDSETEGTGFGHLSLDNVRITNGTVTYFDARTGREEKFSAINATVALESLDEPLRLQGDLVRKGEKLSVDLAVAQPRQLLNGKGSALALTADASLVRASFAGRASNTISFELDGLVELSVPSLRNLAAWSGTILTAPDGTLEQLHLKGKVKRRASNFEFTDAEIDLDAIRAQGKISLLHGAENPQIMGNLGFQFLDLNPYIMPSGGGTDAASSNGWSDEKITVSNLSALDLNLDVSFGGLVIRRMKFGRGALTAKAKDGVLNMHLASLELYEGTARGTLLLDGAKADSVGVDLNGEMSKVNLEALLKDATREHRLSGSAEIALAVRSRGGSQRALVEALQGKGRIDVQQGAIRGINLGAMMVHVATAFAAGDPSAKTEFSQMRGTFAINAGVASNSDMTLRSSVLEADGSGTINLGRRTMDYKITPKFVTPMVGKVTGDLLTVRVPVLVRGSFDKLRFEPDMTGILKQGIDTPGNLIDGVLAIPGAVIGGGKEKDEKKEDSAPVKTLDALKGLFGR